jgi:hypothetical protein
MHGRVTYHIISAQLQHAIMKAIMYAVNTKYSSWAALLLLHDFMNLQVKIISIGS